MIKIETERLILRPFTLDDVDAAYEMNLDSKVSKFTGDGGVVSKDEVTKRITEHTLADYKKYGYGRLAVVLKSKNVFIGFAGLKYLDDMDEVDLGYRFMSQYWGQGLATEACKPLVEYAFTQLELNKIIAMVLPENSASIRVLDKLGFSFDKKFVEDDLLISLYQLKKNK